MRIALKITILVAMLGALGTLLPVQAKERFSTVKRGKFTNLDIEYGKLTCKDGVAEIGDGGKSGDASLRMFGGNDTELRLDLKDIPTKDVTLSAWAERWTGQAPFDFTIVAVGPNGEKEIYNGKNIKTGGFNTKIDTKIPAGTKSLLFKLTSPENKGIKIDDLFIVPCIPMKVDSSVETETSAYPVIKRIQGNPVLSMNVKTEGCLNPTNLNAVRLDFTGTDRLQDIEKITVVRGSEKADLPEGAAPFPSDPAQVLGAATPGTDNTIVVKGNLELDPGDNYMWVYLTMKDDAPIGGKISVKPTGIKAGDKVLKVSNTEPAVQRIGTAVVRPGDFNSKFYRIPGLARTKKGTLLAVYDIRYNHAGDLPANIDVGVSRSADGGKTWSPVSIAIDDSKINPELGETKGVGDPAILVDEKTGRVWVAAIWSHKHSIWGSQPGDNSPDSCGQLVLAYSDDDGKTWSKPINITEQTKDKDWRILFNGPGSGICMKDGTLVFAAQYWDGQGIPWSTIVYSKDNGQTWHCGTGVHEQTTEAQVVELRDGSIMINARCNWGGSRVVGITRNLGKSWTMHSTNRSALQEPVCQGSILAVDKVPGVGRVVFFSNPNTTSGRWNMTLKASVDDADTWPEDKWLLYDVRPSWGYSCLAPVDKNHLGILYEARGSLNFLKISYKEIMGQDTDTTSDKK